PAFCPGVDAGNDVKPDWLAGRQAINPVGAAPSRRVSGTALIEQVGEPSNARPVGNFHGLPRGCQVLSRISAVREQLGGLNNAADAPVAEAVPQDPAAGASEQPELPLAGPPVVS